MTDDTVKTRLLIISDTHTAVPNQASAVNPSQDATPHQYAYRHPLPKADVLLHAGDLTMVGDPGEYKKIIDFLKTADAELKLVIAGNHDITLDRDYCEKYGGVADRNGSPVDLDAVREMWTGEDARRHGIVYLEQGTRTFTLPSGAMFTIFTSPYQPEFCNWAFAYEREEDVFNPSSTSQRNPPLPTVPSHPDIDLMMTHGPPLNRLDRTTRGEAVGCEHLLRAVERCRPRLHCFGHIHEGWGAERIRWKPFGSNGPETSESDPEDAILCANELEVDLDKAMAEDRAVVMDVSHEGGKGLRFGEETLFVNAAIMNVGYRPVNAPWLIDLDLPRARRTEHR